MDYDLFEYEKMPYEKYMQMYMSIGAAMEVYNYLHRGLEEALYQEALEIELASRNIPYEAQRQLQTWYKDRPLKKKYFADIVTYSDIIMELKSVSKIATEHRAQLFNYLRIAQSTCGVLINFGDNSFYCERYWYVKKLDDFFIITKNNLTEIVREK